jgi:anti-anti-sigma factor
MNPQVDFALPCQVARNRNEGVVVLFEIERTTSFDVPVLRAVGELDLSTAPALTRAADAEFLLEPAGLVVDLTPTTFMDSSGARTLAQLARRATAGGVALQVVCPRENSAVRLVIDLLELRSVVPIVESVPGRPAGRVGVDDAP